MPAALDQLRTHLAEVHDLEAVGAGLAWDQQTMMPRRGAGLRAEALATVESVAHERFVSDEVGTLLERAAGEVDGADPDGFEASLVRVARRDWDKARRVPAELKAQTARAAAISFEAWARAREQSDWSAFEPHLAELLELKLRYVECFPDVAALYDALLDDYEPGMTSAEVQTVFDAIKQGLVPLIAAIAERPGAVDDSCLHGEFPAEVQERLGRKVIERLGFEPDAWRLDTAVHPFATGFGTQDIRITTRYETDFFNAAFFSMMHETGHGLYEAGSDPSLERSPLVGGVSLGLHESQSRLWENLVGRGRPFSSWLLPQLAEAFPQQFGAVDLDTYYGAINKVEPSLIRVEADEATYSLHVILRFELEQEMLSGALALRDLPEAWNAKMHEYLGVEVPDDAHGVLQDVHWSEGIIGYFPTYALGNVMSAQIWAAARGELSALDEELARGDVAALREWLRDRLYRHGRKFTPAETLERTAGAPLDPEPYLAYLREKLGAVYGL